MRGTIVAVMIIVLVSIVFAVLLRNSRSRAAAASQVTMGMTAREVEHLMGRPTATVMAGSNSPCRSGTLEHQYDINGGWIWRLLPSRSQMSLIVCYSVERRVEITALTVTEY